LQPDAATFQSHHGWRAPLSFEVFSAAAGHGTTAVAAPYSKGEFHDRRQYDDTVGLIKHALGNAVGRR
jgi:hypothetical protein